MLVTRLKNWIRKQMPSIEIDLTKNNDKELIKLVAMDFLMLSLLLFLVIGFRFPVSTLIVMPFVQFFLLQRWFKKVQEKYTVLLKETNEIANGNLDKDIEADLWIFNPLKEELKNVQRGFKNAVEKEVKSQRMKTELITNVSHDLKTPLTSIITYVDLLKTEQTKEKRREYIEILERKAMRLKLLIEDLFEISKASSNNIVLNLVEVDVVNLFKQVKLELEEQIEEANLDFRMYYPEEKVCAMLDSQVTYRIFENLLINVVKYAMAGTRVYVEISLTRNDVVIKMKNVSAMELHFSPDEITERFVRGDMSRNTAGSGLGLAIAKSFTEIQKGKFKIEVEADLFKVEIRFPVAEK